MTEPPWVVAVTGKKGALRKSARQESSNASLNAGNQFVIIDCNKAIGIFGHLEQGCAALQTEFFRHEQGAVRPVSFSHGAVRERVRCTSK
jgi:hypothetical protein